MINKDDDKNYDKNYDYTDNKIIMMEIKIIVIIILNK